MRHYFIVGNHKMNLAEYEDSTVPRQKDGLRNAEPASREREHRQKLINILTLAVHDGLTVVLCPMLTRLERFTKIQKTTGVAIGAQNCHWEQSGAYTGEVSAAMLAEMGCTWVIVGHSERRRDQYETDGLIGRKASAALASGIRPIICIGETLEQRKRGTTNAVLVNQIRGIHEACGSLVFDASVIAYEPVWAIGTGLSATTEEIEAAHRAIREYCREMHILDMPILYGGSVSADNAEEIFSCRHVNGVLVGGASLSSETFGSIVESAIICAHA